MEKTAKRFVYAPFALSIATALVGCSGAESEPPSPESTPAGDTQTSSGATSAEQEEAATATEEADSTNGGNPSADSDMTALGLAAIAAAESAAGGQAYQIDDLDDDKTWEVDVRVGSASIEVTVSGDGSQVYSKDGVDLDDDLDTALAGASITLSDAIQIAVEESGGMLREVELEDPTDAQPAHWEVSMRTGQPHDTEVLVSMTGKIIDISG